MIYLFFFLFTLLAMKIVPQNLVIKCGEKKISIAPYVTMLPLFLLSALRYEVGRDYYTYTAQYFVRGYGNSKSEVVFSWLIILCKKITNDPQSLIVSLSFLFCVFLFLSIYEFSEKVEYSVIFLALSGLYFFSLTMMRQCISIVLFLYSLKYFCEKKYIKTGILILVAVLFHATGYVFIAFYLAVLVFELVYKTHNAKLLKMGSIIALIVFYSMQSNLRTFIFDFFLNLGVYRSYFNSIHDSGNSSFTYILLAGIPFIISIFSERPKIEKGEKGYLNPKVIKYDTFYWAQWTGVLLAVLLPIIPNGERMVMMFSAVSVLSIPFFINRIRNAHARIIILPISIVLLVFVVYRFFIVNDALYILPYKTIWSR